MGIGTRRGAPQIFCIYNTTTPSTIDTSANPPRPSRTPTSMPCRMARGSPQNQGDIPLCLYDRGLGLHTIKMGTRERGAIDHQGIGRFEIDPVSNRFGSWQRSHVQHIWQRPHTQQMWKKLNCVDGVMKIHDITSRLKELLGGHNESNGVLMLENLQTSYTWHVDGVLKRHNITGWLKELVGGSLMNEVDTGKSSHERGMIKLHDLTGLVDHVFVATSVFETF